MFVKNFIEILEKHMQYIVVSGFISIATGRNKGTEDVDVLIPIIEPTKFKKLFKELQEKDFWCYQGDTAEEACEYIKKGSNIRFAKINQMFPNIEIIPVGDIKKIQLYELNHPQKMKIQNFEFNIPSIEFEILYKELSLGMDKDFADAKHLRTMFSEILKKEKFKEYEKIIRS